MNVECVIEGSVGDKFAAFLCVNCELKLPLHMYKTLCYTIKEKELFSRTISTTTSVIP